MQDENVLRENFEYFQQEKPKLLAEPNKLGKYVVVHEKKIKGTFGNFEDAYVWAKAELKDENFIIQQIVDDAEITNFVYEYQCR